MKYSKIDEKHGDDGAISPHSPAAEKRRQQELWQIMLRIVNIIAVIAIGAFYAIVSIRAYKIHVWNQFLSTTGSLPKRPRDSSPSI